MIQANELRIGNLLNWNADHLCGGISKVIRINEYGFEIESNKKCHPIEREMHEVEPIPLTPELLEACGFKHSHHRINPLETEERYSFRINETDYSACFVTDFYGGKESHDLRFRIGYDDIIYPARFKYLHDLQNAIYFFTGTELEVNLPTLNKRDIHPFMY